MLARGRFTHLRYDVSVLERTGACDYGMFTRAEARGGR
jgi:hypothetical protein